MVCYACPNEGAHRCPRCGAAYCPEHGANLCAACLDPVSAAPSSAVFRTALFGMLVFSVLALWLLVRPPSVPSEGSSLGQQPTAAPTAVPGAATAAPTSAPGGATVVPTGAASPTPTDAPASTEAPAGPIEYTVQEGDTLSSIAAAYGVSAADLAAVNSLGDADFISPGDVLVIPQ